MVDQENSHSQQVYEKNDQSKNVWSKCSFFRLQMFLKTCSFNPHSLFSLLEQSLHHKALKQLFQNLIFSFLIVIGLQTWTSIASSKLLLLFIYIFNFFFRIITMGSLLPWPLLIQTVQGLRMVIPEMKMRRMMGLHGAFGENSYYLTENEGKLMIFICGVKPHASNFLLLETVNTFFIQK